MCPWGGHITVCGSLIIFFTGKSPVLCAYKNKHFFVFCNLNLGSLAQHADAWNILQWKRKKMNKERITVCIFTQLLYTLQPVWSRRQSTKQEWKSSQKTSRKAKILQKNILQNRTRQQLSFLFERRCRLQ